MANPFTVECPNCESRLKIQNPKAVGKKVRCPNCQNPFTVNPPRSRPPRDEFEPEDNYDDDDDFGGAPDEFDEEPRQRASRKAAPARGSRGRRKSRGKSSGNKKVALIAGLAVLGLLFMVGAGFVIYSLASGPSEVDYAWLPPESQMVVSIDVDEIYNSSIGQRVRNSELLGNMSNGWSDIERKLKDAGFQEGESVDSIDYMVLGSSSPGQEPLGVIHKKTPWDIEAIKKKDNLKDAVHEGKTYYAGSPDSVYFPDSKTAVRGPERLVKEAIERGPKSDLAEKFSFLPKGQIVVGFLSDDPSRFVQKNAVNRIPNGKEYLKDMNDAMHDAKGAAIAMNFGSGIEFEVLGKLANSEAAAKFSSGLNHAIPDGRKMIAEKRKEMAHMPQVFKDGFGLVEIVYNTISASQSGDTVTVSFEITSSVFDQIEQLGKDNKGGFGGGMFDFRKFLPNMMGPSRRAAFQPQFDQNAELPLEFDQPPLETADRGMDEVFLKQIGRACQDYYDDHNVLPGGNGPDGKPTQLSWRVHILPYLEEDELYQQFHLDEAWDSPHNMPLVHEMPLAYRRPLFTPGAGKNGLMEHGGGKKFSQITDGLSNTALVVGVGDSAAAIWTKPEDYVYDVNNPTQDLDIWTPDRDGVKGGIHMLLADGSVRFIPKAIDPQTLLYLFQMNDGKVPANFLPRSN